MTNDTLKGQRVIKKPSRRQAATGLEDVAKQLCHPKSDLKACLLLLIARIPAHGYELVDSLRAFGYQDESPARIYRALRWLEEAGLLYPTWDMSGAGPARRVYALTEAGGSMIEGCVDSLQVRSQALEAHFSSMAGQGLEREGAKSFEVLVEAKLSVTAPDPDAARQAVESTLGNERQLGVGVRSTGHLWVYEAVERS